MYLTCKGLCNNFTSPSHPVQFLFFCSASNICSQPATCLLSNAILMYAMQMLIISAECTHVKLNMHNRIVKNHFIRGDHSLSPSSLSVYLSLSLSKCRLSGLSIHWSVCLCVCVCWYSACLHTPTRACFPGDTQLRVLGGWQRDGRVSGGGDRGVACQTGDGKGDLRGGEVMRGVAGGELRRGWQQCKARPGGWHGGGASLCPGPPLSLLVAFSDSICSLLYMQNTPCREGVYTWG